MGDGGWGARAGRRACLVPPHPARGNEERGTAGRVGLRYHPARPMAAAVPLPRLRGDRPGRRGTRGGWAGGAVRSSAYPSPRAGPLSSTICLQTCHPERSEGSRRSRPPRPSGPHGRRTRDPWLRRRCAVVRSAPQDDRRTYRPCSPRGRGDDVATVDNFGRTAPPRPCTRGRGGHLPVPGPQSPVPSPQSYNLTASSARTNASSGAPPHRWRSPNARSSTPFSGS